MYRNATLFGFCTVTSTSRLRFKWILSGKSMSKSKSLRETEDTVITGRLALYTVKARITMIMISNRRIEIVAPMHMQIDLLLLLLRLSE